MGAEPAVEGQEWIARACCEGGCRWRPNNATRVADVRLGGAMDALLGGRARAAGTAWFDPERKRWSILFVDCVVVHHTTPLAAWKLASWAMSTA